MRIVNRSDFLKLPPGTLFCAFTERFAFGDLMIKFDSLYFESGGTDFISMALNDPRSASSGELFAALDAMADDGASVPLDLDCAGRDGMFEDEEMYLVYELADMKQLHGLLGRLIQEQAEVDKTDGEPDAADHG